MQLKIAFLATLFATSVGTLYAASDAEALFQAKCASCHVTTKPQDFSTLVAPPVMGVMRHVKMHYKTQEDAVNFIVDYALNPQRDKAVCNADKIKRFGLMPSQKERVSKEELTRIATWMYATFPAMTQGGQGCKNTPKTSHAKGKNCKSTPTNKASSQFLISGAMPHMTKLLKQQWDNKELNLSPAQKEKLLVVRQNTMKAVKSITPRIKGLESTIIRKTMAAEKPEVLEPMVKKLAQLKAKATNVHIRCIYDTINILTKEQIAWLSK